MIKTKPWSGGTDEEYQTQHFGFGVQRFQIATREMVEQKITACVKDMEAGLLRSLDLNETDKSTFARSCDKLIRLYCEKAEPSLKVIDSEIENILTLPVNILLPGDEVQIIQMSEEEHMTLKEEVDGLRKRVERGALMEALLSAEEEELASAEKICEIAKKDMDVLDLMDKCFSDDQIKSLQDQTRFLRASVPFLEKADDYEI